MIPEGSYILLPLVMQKRKLVDMPWHKIQADQEVPHVVGAPTKRTPIRGKCSLT
jgi:hypothetical protein